MYVPSSFLHVSCNQIVVDEEETDTDLQKDVVEFVTECCRLFVRLSEGLQRVFL